LATELCGFSRVVCRKAAGIRPTVGDGGEGLNRAKDVLPDLIQLGMMLPAMEGRARLCQVTPDPRTQLIPVIVLSGLSPKNENRLRLAGAAVYFEKSMLNLSGEGVPCLMLDKA